MPRSQHGWLGNRDAIQVTKATRGAAHLPGPPAAAPHNHPSAIGAVAHRAAPVTARCPAAQLGSVGVFHPTARSGWAAPPRRPQTLPGATAAPFTVPTLSSSLSLTLAGNRGTCWAASVIWGPRGGTEGTEPTVVQPWFGGPAFLVRDGWGRHHPLHALLVGTTQDTTPRGRGADRDGGDTRGRRAPRRTRGDPKAATQPRGARPRCRSGTPRGKAAVWGCRRRWDSPSAHPTVPHAVSLPRAVSPFQALLIFQLLGELIRATPTGSRPSEAAIPCPAVVCCGFGFFFRSKVCITLWTLCFVPSQGHSHRAWR